MVQLYVDVGKKTTLAGGGALDILHGAFASAGVVY
jgi:hypothetical protein